MSKLDGMDPGAVRGLLAEIKQVAKKMRTVDARVGRLLSTAGVPVQTTYRPSQVADDAEKLARDVETRLTLLEKEEKQKNRSTKTPDSMGGAKPADDAQTKDGADDKKSKDDADDKSTAGKNAGAAGGKGDEGARSDSAGKSDSGKGGDGEKSGGKGGEGDKAGSGESGAGKGGDGEKAGGKGGEGDRSGAGKDSGSGGYGSVGGEIDPGQDKRGEGDKSGGGGAGADKGGDGDGSGPGRETGGDCDRRGGMPDGSGGTGGDKGGEGTGSEGGNDYGGDAIVDTDGKDHPDDIAANPGMRVIEVDGVKIATGSMERPSEAYLRWLEQNMDKIQPSDMPGGDGQLAPSTANGAQQDGAPGRTEPSVPDTGKDSGNAAGQGGSGSGGAPCDGAGNSGGGAVRAGDAFARGDVSIVNRDGISLMPHIEGSGAGDGAAKATGNDAAAADPGDGRDAERGGEPARGDGDRGDGGGSDRAERPLPPMGP